MQFISQKIDLTILEVETVLKELLQIFQFQMSTKGTDTDFKLFCILLQCWKDKYGNLK